jgi:hypothetical protein
LLAVGVVGCMLFAASANATPPQDVLIQVQTVSVPNSDASGPFTASGPVCPTGTTSTPFRRTAGFERGTGGEIFVGKEFTCDDGSGSFLLVLHVTITFEPFSDTFTWRVMDGTGAYENLHGTGSGTGVPMPDFLLDTFTGEMHID